MQYPENQLFNKQQGRWFFNIPWLLQCCPKFHYISLKLLEQKENSSLPLLYIRPPQSLGYVSTWHWTLCLLTSGVHFGLCLFRVYSCPCVKPHCSTNTQLWFRQGRLFQLPAARHPTSPALPASD